MQHTSNYMPKRFSTTSITQKFHNNKLIDKKNSEYLSYFRATTNAMHRFFNSNVKTLSQQNLKECVKALNYDVNNMQSTMTRYQLEDLLEKVDILKARNKAHLESPAGKDTKELLKELQDNIIMKFIKNDHLAWGYSENLFLVYSLNTIFHKYIIRVMQFTRRAQDVNIDKELRIIRKFESCTKIYDMIQKEIKKSDLSDLDANKLCETIYNSTKNFHIVKNDNFGDIYKIVRNNV